MYGDPRWMGSWWRILTKHGPLKKGMANHFSILAWRIPMDIGGWWARVRRVTKSQTCLKQLRTHSDGSRVKNQVLLRQCFWVCCFIYCICHTCSVLACSGSSWQDYPLLYHHVNIFNNSAWISLGSVPGLAGKLYWVTVDPYPLH